MPRTREIFGGLIILTGATLMFAGERLWAWASNQPTGDDALIIAVVLGETDTARRAISAGASIDGQSMFGYTPLILAAGVGDERLVRFLLAHGAAVDATGPHGWTALGYAACGTADVPTMRVLLHAGACPDGARPDGRSGTTMEFSRPLVSGITSGHYAAAELLLTWGADPNLYQMCGSRTSPLTAAAFAGGDNQRIVGLLIAAGADVNRPDGQGVTPLRAATEAGDAALAKILRQAGADARLN